MSSDELSENEQQEVVRYMCTADKKKCSFHFKCLNACPYLHVGDIFIPLVVFIFFDGLELESTLDFLTPCYYGHLL